MADRRREDPAQTETWQARRDPKSETSILDAFKSANVYVLCVIYFTLMIGLYGIAFWLPTIVKALGVQGYWNVGLLSAIPWGFATVGMLIVSRAFRPDRRTPLALCAQRRGGRARVSARRRVWRQPNAVDHIPVDRNAWRGRINAVVLADPFRFPHRNRRRHRHRHRQLDRQPRRLCRSQRRDLGEGDFAHPAAAMYAIAILLLIGAAVMLLFIPASLRVRAPSAGPERPKAAK